MTDDQFRRVRENISVIRKVRKNINAMMEARGFRLITEATDLWRYTEDPPEIPLVRLGDKIVTNDSVYPEKYFNSRHINDAGKIMYVYFMPTIPSLVGDEVYKDEMRKFMENPVDEDSRLVAVSKYDLKPSEKLPHKGKFRYDTVEYLACQNLLMNPTTHKFIPKHELMTDDEIKSQFGNLDTSKFPEIKVTDPISRWYDAKPKQIFRIRRMNFTTDVIDETLYYRIVVA
jgi:DNA-directed RNA polymerase subunit H (RpoH/RPB5)